MVYLTVRHSLFVKTRNVNFLLHVLFKGKLHPIKGKYNTNKCKSVSDSLELIF
jgi:hypothetical protein